MLSPCRCSPTSNRLYVVLFLSLLSDVTSWRDGGGRALAPTLPGEGAAEGGTGGALVMDGAAGVPHPNPQIQGPPRNPPAGSPALPLPQPPVGPGFPPFRGIMPPFVRFLFYYRHLIKKKKKSLTRVFNVYLFVDVSPLSPVPGPLWPSGALQVPATWGGATSKVGIQILSV